MPEAVEGSFYPDYLPATGVLPNDQRGNLRLADYECVNISANFPRLHPPVALAHQVLERFPELRASLVVVISTVLQKTEVLTKRSRKEEPLSNYR